MENNVNPAGAGNGEIPEAAPGANPEEGQPAGGAEDKPSEPNPSEPQANLQEHDWKKRYEGTSQAHKQLSEKHERTVKAQVKLVEKNPSILDDLADTDPELADEVSQKLHGKSFEEYQKDVELESLRKNDPDAYEREKRLRKTESKLANQEKKERAAFLAEKGIKDSTFDPDYQKLQAELNMLNPAYVEENPIEALKKAHSLAFPGSSDPNKEKADAALAGNTSKKGGLSTGAGTGAPSGKSDGAKAFRNQMAKLTGK